MSDGAESSELEASERSTASAMVEAEAREGYKWVQLGPKSIEIPEEWMVSVLSKVSDINMGSSPSSEYYNESEDGMSFFQGNADFGYRYPTPEVWCTKPDKVAEEGDILISVRAPVGELNFANTDCCIGRGLAAIRGTTSDSGFVFYSLSHSRQRLESYAQGSTFDSVNSKVLQNFPIAFPKISEQHRIAEVLSTVDEQIQQTEAVIETTEELKRGLMQDIITRGIGHESFTETLLGPHHIEIPSSWEVERMTDITDIVSGSTPKRSNVEYWDGNIVWVTPTDVTGNDGMYLSDSEDQITKAGLNSCSAKLLSPGAVLMTSRATIGEAVINEVPVATNQGFKSLVCGNRIHNEYLYYYIQTIANYLTEIGGGSTFPEINKTDTSNIRVPVPPFEEQKRIAGIVSHVGRKRLQEMRYKEHLQELKRGLMQDLLTGTVRVPDSLGP